MTQIKDAKAERAFIAAVQAEIAAGRAEFDRDTVQQLIRAYNREAARFDSLAFDVAFNIVDDDSHLDTMYREFASMRNRLAEVDAFGMRDQIDREDAKEAPDV